MANRLLKNPQTLEQGVVTLYGQVVTSTSGTISSSSCKGFTIAKTATESGRYTVTLADTYTKVLSVNVNLVGASDTAYTDGKGMWTGLLRNVSVADSTPTFDIQFADPDGNADADVADGVSFYLEIVLKNSSAY